MARSKSKPMVITMSGDRSIKEVARDLGAAGFNVEQVLEFTGTVTGSASANIASRLRAIPGVADVSDDHPVDIGPPGAGIS